MARTLIVGNGVSDTVDGEVSGIKYHKLAVHLSLHNLKLAGLGNVNYVEVIRCVSVSCGNADLYVKLAVYVGDSITEHKLDVVYCDECSDVALTCKCREVKALELLHLGDSGKNVACIDTLAADLNDNVLGLKAVSTFTGGNGQGCGELCGLGEVRIGGGELCSNGVDTDLLLSVALVGNGYRLGKSAGNSEAVCLVIKLYCQRIECDAERSKVILKACALDRPLGSSRTGEGYGVVCACGERYGSNVCTCVDGLSCHAVVGSGVNCGYDACKLSGDIYRGVSKNLTVVGGISEVCPGDSAKINGLGSDLPLLVVYYGGLVGDDVVCLVCCKKGDGSLCVVDADVGLFVVGVYYGYLIGKAGSIKGYGDRSTGVGDGCGVAPLKVAEGENSLSDVPLLGDGHAVAAYLVAAYGKHVVGGGEKLDKRGSGVLTCVLTGRGSTGDLKERQLLCGERRGVKRNGDIGAGIGDGIGVIPGKIYGNSLLLDDVFGRKSKVASKNVVGRLRCLYGNGNAVCACIGGGGNLYPLTVLILFVYVLKNDTCVSKVLKLRLLARAVIDEIYVGPIKVVGRDYCLCDRPLLGRDGAAYIVVGSNKGVIYKVEICGCDDGGCSIGSGSVLVNDSSCKILGCIADLNTEYGAVIGEVKFCGIVSCIGNAVCDPGERGEIDGLCCDRPRSAGKLCGACPCVVRAADNVNGRGGLVGACVGKCVVGIYELKLCRIGCGYGVGLAVLVNHILRNVPYDIAIVERLGIDGPIKGYGIAVCKCVVIACKSKSNGGGVILCIGAGVAGGSLHGYDGRILCLNGSVYALLRSVILERARVIPLNEVRRGESLGIDLDAYLIGGSLLCEAEISNGDNAMVIAGLSYVRNLKGSLGRAVYENVILVPCVCIGGRSHHRSCGSGEDYSALAVYYAISRRYERCGSVSGNSIELNVLCGHLGVERTRRICPTDNGVTVIIGGT